MRRTELGGRAATNRHAAAKYGSINNTHGKGTAENRQHEQKENIKQHGGEQRNNGNG